MRAPIVLVSYTVHRLTDPRHLRVCLDSLAEHGWVVRYRVIVQLTVQLDVTRDTLASSAVQRSTMPRSK
jgi:hypothetical protein